MYVIVVYVHLCVCSSCSHSGEGAGGPRWWCLSEEPLRAPGSQRGGSPQPSVPGKCQPQGSRDLDESQIFSLSCHLLHHAHKTDSWLRHHRKVSYAHSATKPSLCVVVEYTFCGLLVHVCVYCSASNPVHVASLPPLLPLPSPSSP